MNGGMRGKTMGFSSEKTSERTWYVILSALHREEQQAKGESRGGCGAWVIVIVPNVCGWLQTKLHCTLARSTPVVQRAIWPKTVQV
jgi:hypothetical protein